MMLRTTTLSPRILQLPRIFSPLRRASFSPWSSNLPAQKRLLFKNMQTTCQRYSSSSAELIKALEQEISEEKRLENEDLGGSSPPTIPGFGIKTKDAEVTLTKTFGQEKIYVTFNVNHSVDVEMNEEDSEVSAEETQHVPASLPAFTIEILKGEDRLCFEAKLIETEDHLFDYVVDEFYMTKGGHSVKVDDAVYASSGEYIDPALHDLFFAKYMEERGFTTDFCQSLANYATHYEHSQYVNLLKKIKEFISK